MGVNDEFVFTPLATGTPETFTVAAGTYTSAGEVHLAITEAIGESAEAFSTIATGSVVGTTSGGVVRLTGVTAVNGDAISAGANDVTADFGIPLPFSGGALVSEADLTVTASGQGAFAQGYVTADAGLTIISASAPGAFAQGYAHNSGSIAASGKAAFAQGYVRDGTISSASDGTFAQGYAVLGGLVTAGGFGAFAQGYTKTGATIAATSKGAFAQGYGASSSFIFASGYGSSAQGFASSAGEIFAAGYGCFAQGRATGGKLFAEGYGSFALGYAAGSSGLIHASGTGAFAQGYADHATIAATAANAVQFGPGTNALADSLQIGTGIQIIGIVGANSSPANGQIWREGNVVKIRSNGATVSL